MRPTRYLQSRSFSLRDLSIKKYSSALKPLYFLREDIKIIAMNMDPMFLIAGIFVIAARNVKINYRYRS